MTLPGGAANVNTTDGILLVSAHGHGDLSAAALVGNDRATMEAVYKSHYMGAGSGSVWANSTGPLGMVFNLLGALPGVGFAFAILGNLVDAIITILGPIPIIGSVVTTLASFLGLTHNTANSAQTTGQNAQTGANVANVEVAIIKAQLAADGIGGAALSDRFDGPAAASLNTGRWSQVYAGPGIGDLGLDGSGNAVWHTAGGGDRASFNFFLNSLDTNNESVTVLLGSVPASSNATWPEISLLLRMNGTGNAVAARIYNGHLQIGYLASNAFTALGSPVSVAMSGQQSYQFKVSTSGAVHVFSILQDNVEIVTATSPTSGPTLYGASYRHPGWIASAGTDFVFPFYYQIPPPVVRVFSAGDIA